MAAGNSNAGMAGRFSRRTKQPAQQSPSPKKRSAPRNTQRKSAKRVSQKKSVSKQLLRRANGRPNNIPPLWLHQKQTLQFDLDHPRVNDNSDPGIGKTRAHLEAIVKRPGSGSRAALVVAPKSLLESAWGHDIRAFTPELAYVCAYAENREEAFATDADVYITNTDATKWLARQNKKFFSRFDTIIGDEITAFKHRTSQRSMALAKIQKYFKYRTGMTGTPNSRTITDVWNQIYFLDDGARLGTSFFHFRNQVTAPVQVGPSPRHVDWRDIKDAEKIVAQLIQDITIRHKFEDCMDIPPNHTQVLEYEISPKLRKMYETMADEMVLELQDINITAINAAVLRDKLLQMLSGAIYAPDGSYKVLDTGRYELVMDLIEAREQVVVFFNWTHQREQLARLAKKRNISFAIIDGKVKQRDRDIAVERFQAGKLKAMFLHPKTGAHGLTLTRGRTTIWSSPIYQPDFLKQGNHRIYRGGQTHKTESILIEASNTVDSLVYKSLNDKKTRMLNFLDILHEAKKLRGD